MVSVDEIAAYWSKRPCNVAHSDAPVGSVEWSEGVTARKRFVEPHIAEFADFPRWRGCQVLDVGCGIGTDSIAFANAGARYVAGVDLSSVTIQMAMSRVRALVWSPNFQCLNAEEYLPYARYPGGYDLIYAFGMLHHTPRPDRVLKLAFNRLKPGGELRVMLYAKWSIKFLAGRQPEAQAGCPLARAYTARAARQIVEGAGFRVESVRKAHIFPWKLREYVAYRYVKALPYAWMPTWLFAWLERRLGHHLLLVARKP